MLWCLQRTMSGEQYTMTMLGRRRASTTRELLYTSLLPSAGPTRLCYDIGSNIEADNQIVPYRSNHASNIIWTDLDGAPLTVRRKSSHLGFDFGELNVPNMSRRQSNIDIGDTDEQDLLPRRQRRSLTNNYDLDDYDTSTFIYRRPSKEEREDYGEHYRAIVPIQPVIVEENLDAPPVSSLCRSDTVANLLTKYSNFSTRREFGYHAPDSAWSRHFGKTNDFLATLPDYGEDEPPLRDDSSNMALVPASKSQTPKLYDEDDIISSRIMNSKDRSRSQTPRGISVGKESSIFARESLEESLRERSRGLDSSSSFLDDSRRFESLGREEVSIPSSRKRFSNIYEEDEDSLLLQKPKEEKNPEPVSTDVPDYLMQMPEQIGPRGRPGGALERYRARKAKEAQGIFEYPDYSSYYKDDESESDSIPKKKAQSSQPPKRRDTQEDIENSTYDSPQARESSKRHLKELHSKSSEESRRHNSKQESHYEKRQDGYSRSTQSQYSRASRDPYSPPPTEKRRNQVHESYSPPPTEKRRSQVQEPYHRSVSDSYSQLPSNDRREDVYERMPSDPYGRMPQDPYERPGNDPFNGRSVIDPYDGRPMHDPYGRRPAYDSYGLPPSGPSYRQNLEEEDFSRRSSRGQRSRRGPEEDLQYGGSYAKGRQRSDRSTEECGNGYNANYGSGGGGGGGYGYGGYSELSNGSEYFSGRRERTMTKVMPFIDEEDRGGRSLTPREEERRAVGKLASKYLKPRSMRDYYADDE